MKQIIFGLLAGLLFGSGLTISMMVEPQRVIAFLDVFGHWDPTLAFVMGGGLLVYLPVYFGFIHKQQKTIFGLSCDLPTKKKVNTKLLIGSSLFGIGWGVSGICPGPALTSLTSLNWGIIVFVTTMLVGFFVAHKIELAISR